MSSDADDDSGFDKEAEREKLRKKYEADQQDREATQRMSELLLQGATMTGKHCDACGDPIFRYDGQEFCPTCQHEVQQAEQPGQQADQQVQQAERGADAASPEATEPETGADQSRETPDEPASRGTESQEADEPAAPADREDEPRVEIDEVRPARRPVDDGPARRPVDDVDSHHRHAVDQAADESARDETGRERVRDATDSEIEAAERRRRERAASGGPRRSRGRSSAGDAGDLDEARAALARKLTTLCRQVEETEDVSRVRGLLAAVEEAADALAAIDRANR